MPQLRDELLAWIESGHLKPEDTPRALEIAGLSPQPADWRKFLNSLLLWMGTLLIAAGVIFFFAYNWQSLPRLSKFALAEAVFLAALLTAWRFGAERIEGKAALLGASLLTGALLALLGQTYQTGADTFELFAYWAALILPWVIAARLAPLWLLWIGLLNLAAWTYFDAGLWGVLGVLFGGPGARLWAMFGLNAVALAAWELGLAMPITWLSRWGARVLALLAGGFATAIGILAVSESREIGAGAIPMYLAWILAMYLYYRHRVVDVFMLAGGILSAILVVAVFLGSHLLRRADAGGFLLIGLVVLGMSAGGAAWIRHVLQEDHEE